MSFNRLAPHYRWMELVLAGSKLQRARTAWISTVGPVRRALLAGEGNGRFLTVALAAWPHTEFHCVDASPAMLRRARERLTPAEDSRVTFEVARLPAWVSPSKAFDLVVTHFFLDCFPPGELRRVIEVLAGATESNAAWLLADFAIPARGLARRRAQAIHWAMYRFFRLATRLEARSLTPPEPVLSELGFVCAESRKDEWGLLRSSLWRRSPNVARA